MRISQVVGGLAVLFLAVSCGAVATTDDGGAGGGGTATGGGAAGGGTGGGDAGTGGGDAGAGAGGGDAGAGGGDAGAGGGDAGTGGGDGGAIDGGADGGATGGGGGSTLPDGGLSCAAPLPLAYDGGVAASTTGGSNDFEFAKANGCEATSSAADALYRVELPALSTALVGLSSGTTDHVLNAIAAPAVNCGVAGAGAACVASSQRTVGTGGFENLVLTNASSAPQAYFLVVDGATSSFAGGYQLTARAGAPVPPGADEVEPNDTKPQADATALALAPGTAVRASLGTSDTDLFALAVPQAGALRVELGAASCDEFDEVKLALLDASGVERFAQTDRTWTTCATLAVQVTAGTWYLSLSRTAAASRPQAYWLQTTLFTTQPPESEPNNSEAQATTLAGPDGIICGALSPPGDTADVYQFTLAQPARVLAEVFESAGGAFTCEPGTATLDASLELRSASSGYGRDTGTGRGVCGRLDQYAVLAPGTYFLTVTEASSSPQGFTYCLSVMVR